MNIIGILYLSLFAQIQEEARSQIIGDIESIAPVGTPGHLSVYGAKAFVLVYAGEKDKELPLAAAATYGEGRIFAIAHSGYLSGSIVETSAGKLVANARAWLSNSGKLEVKVFNERGSFDAVTEVSNDVSPGIVVATLGYWRQLNRGTVNSISSAKLADMGNAPTFSDNLVEVEKI